MVLVKISCIIVCAIALRMKQDESQYATEPQVFYNPDTGEVLTESERQELIKENAAVVDGIIQHSGDDYFKWGFYSVTAEELSEDIQALKNIYAIMKDDEIVPMNKLQYDKDLVADYIVTDEDLLTYFEDDEVILIYFNGGGSEIIPVEDLAAMEEEIEQSSSLQTNN